MSAASPLLASPPDAAEIPKYRIVSRFQASPLPGLPRPYRGQAVRVHAACSLDESSGKVDAEVVRAMMSEGMRALTGDKDERDCWARFVTQKDVVGVKVNCSGAPNIMSAPEVVARVVEDLIAVGVPAGQIYIYERFMNQMRTVRYEQHVPEGVQAVVAAESARGSLSGTIRRRTWKPTSLVRRTRNPPSCGWFPKRWPRLSTCPI